MSVLVTHTHGKGQRQADDRGRVTSGISLTRDLREKQIVAASRKSVMAG